MNGTRDLGILINGIREISLSRTEIGKSGDKMYKENQAVFFVEATVRA